MVIKTQQCYYSEYRIYPGHGRSYVRRDGRMVTFLNQKCRSLFNQKIKAQRLTWTQQWRRIRKKGVKSNDKTKKTKRAAKVFRGIAGLTADDLLKKRALKPEMRKANRDQAVREAKDKKKTAAKGAKKEKKVGGAKAAINFVKIPKLTKNIMKTAGK